MVKKYGDLYLQARRALLPSEGENASMAARELLAFASGKSVTAVLADSNLYASEQIEEKLSSYVNRMLAHEPLPYILGQWDFYGISLEVTPDVLIPRDDTMAVTDLALDVLRGREAPRVLDLCCGSGCIGLAIAHQLPDAHVTLADVSRPALAVAKRNIKRLKLMNRVTAVGLDARKRGPSFVGTLDAHPAVCNERGNDAAGTVREGIRASSCTGRREGRSGILPRRRRKLYPSAVRRRISLL